MQQQFQLPEEKRYDAKKLQQVVELATRLQHEHHETLTAAQVEQMGQDLGLSPEFIRKALVLVEEEETRAVSVPPVLQQVSLTPPVATATTGLAPLSQRAIKQAVVPALLYGLPATIIAFVAAFFQRQYPNASPLVLITLCFVLAPLMALMAGLLQRGRRVGALAGLAVGAVAWFAFLVAIERSPYVPTDHVSVILMALLCYLPGGTLLGGLGGLLRRWWDNRPVTEDEARHRAH